MPREESVPAGPRHRSAEVVINSNSGLAGVAHWINLQLGLKGESSIEKKDPRVAKLKEWVDEQYSEGRVTIVYDEELREVAHRLIPDLF